MLPLIGSKWPGWEKYQQMDCGCLSVLEVTNNLFILPADACKLYGRSTAYSAEVFVHVESSKAAHSSL